MPSAAADNLVNVKLSAVVLSVQCEQPMVLVTQHSGPPRNQPAGLPTAQFRPAQQDCLEDALRQSVRIATDLELGHVEQLLTDFERDTLPMSADTTTSGAKSCISVSYLALARDEAPASSGKPAADWVKCYDLLPWEDFREGRPAILDAQILPALEAWAQSGDDHMARSEQLRFAFGQGGRNWDDQRIVDRFDLVTEAGIEWPAPANGICREHIRLVAAGLGRLRGKLRYRPVVFELLPDEFTLFELQRTVEAVLGPTLHKQNFRRLVEGTRLVEATGEVRTNTGGRPAKTFRFRREALLEQPVPGVHVRAGRAA